MVLDLKSVFATTGLSLPVKQLLDMSATDHFGLFPLQQPVEAVGSVSNTAGLVTLHLDIVYAFSAPCDRCGLPTVSHHTVVLEKSLAPELEGEDSDDILLVPDMQLDLEELVYTEVLFSLPMKHLCREDCQGLCPKCGKNLNEGSCGCATKEIDPRLQALADLLK